MLWMIEAVFCIFFSSTPSYPLQAAEAQPQTPQAEQAPHEAQAVRGGTKDTQ
jgi:hypothetical protein